MKVIDAMIKISRGEKVRFEILNNENHIYSSTNGSYLYDETSEEDAYWFIDEDWLNREIKLIEEDKKIEKLTIGKDDVAWCEGNMKTDEEMVDIVLEIKDKINEIIDKINGGTND